MDSDQGKLFIGGISWETTEDKLKDYFGNYGEVTHAVIMRDKVTARPRGFGFVVFADPSLLDRVLQDKHTLDGRTIEAKRALSREEHQISAKSGNANVGRASGGGPGANIRTKKIFVGGLPPTLTEDGFRQYFENYGNVTDVVVMYDQNTQRPRGFGFISFDSEDAVDRVLHKTFHELNGKLVEVKRALPKDANPSGGGSRSVGAGAHQSHGGSGANSDSYDGRLDASRYVQPQAAGGGYPAYGSSGYGAPSFGYGTANNGVGYGSYGIGGYGGATAGYGGATAGYGGATAGYGGITGGYGNPNASPGSYVGGPGGIPRGPWNSQAPTGYSSGGYGGNTTYGAASSWNTPPGGGNGAVPTSQSPSAAAGYGSQGYGYGGYGAAEGPYGSQGGYGAVGGRSSAGPGNNPAGGTGEQGYAGGSYGDVNGNSGYSNNWRSDPSQGGGRYGAAQANGPQGGPASYGGSYAGPGRQPQPQ